MHPSFHDEMAQMIAELTGQKEKLAGAVDELNSLSETATSRNRMVKVSVDSRGRLTEIKFLGNRWRDLSAKELGSLLIGVVTKAQDAVSEKAAGLMSAVAPDGIDIMEMSKNGPKAESFFPDIAKLWGSKE